MELVYDRCTDVWECETCGSIYDQTLTLILDGKVIGDFSEDGHFGYSEIVDTEVEACIIAAVGLSEAELLPLQSRRQCLTEELQALYDQTPDYREEVAYQAHWDQVNAKEVELGRVFPDFLLSLGIQVREEITENYPEYDEDDYADESEEENADVE